MDEKTVAGAITTAFGENVDGFTKAMHRLALQDELQAINSKIANIRLEADKLNSDIANQLNVLNQYKADKQAEIDALETTG